MTVQIFDCQCFYPTHMIRINKFEEENEYYLMFSVDSLGIMRRINFASRYLLGKRLPEGMFDCWLLNNEDLERFKSIIGNRKEFPSIKLDKKYIEVNGKQIETYHNTGGLSNQEYYFEISYDADLNCLCIGASLAFPTSFLQQVWNSVKYIFNFNPRWIEWKLTDSDLQLLYAYSNKIKT